MAKLNEKIAHQARMACEKWREYFKYNIDQYHEMHTFVLGQQWTDDEEEMLKTFKKVPLVCNKLATMANGLLGEQQQNTPQLQVVPLSNCDEETAHLRELVTKDIMFSSDATTTYQVVSGQAAIGGYSAFAWDTDYTHARSFDLDIIPRHFKDATRTYFDVGAEHVNKTDGSLCGYITRMTRPKFREIYGKELEQKISKSASITASKEEIALAVQPNEGDDPFTWADNDCITIIDHYKRKYEPDMLYKLSNGTVLNQEEMDELVKKSKKINKERAQSDMISEQIGDMLGQQEGQKQGQQEQQPGMAMDGMQQAMQEPGMQPEQGQPQGGKPGDMASQGLNQDEQETEADMMPEDSNVMTLWYEGEPIRIEDKREFQRHKIMHYKIAGDYILDSGEFPSEQLPLIFVDQNSYYDKNGKQICRSFFGDAKDTQRYINYIRTQSAFILKVSRYDQFIGSKKNVQSLDTQRNWKDPSAMQGLLTYDESPNGHKPEQIAAPELSASLQSQFQLAIEDLYTCTGLYPSRMGQQGNETSGAAIDARTRQGSYSTYVFFNSINRAIATGGEVVNEMIPRVYDAQRVIALMTPDEGMKNIMVNKQADEYGEHIENDIRKGSYEVRLKPGPSYEGQKQQALDSLQQVLQADPTAFKLVADLYADNLPLSNSLEIKNRLKTMVPQAVIEAGKTGKMPGENGQDQPTPEQQQMQMQQQQMQMQQQYQQQQLELKKQELALKEQQMKVDLDIEHQKLQGEQMKLAGEIEEGKMRYLAETGKTESDQSIAHANNLMKLLTHKIG